MIELEAAAGDAGKRLDQFVHERLPQHSRSRLQDWIKQGRVRVNSKPPKRSYILKGSEHIEVEPAELTPLRAVAEDLPLEILLVHRFVKLSHIGGDMRPGIVHRLDRFTSGVILVARTDAAHRHLAEQFSSRRVEKIYLALVHGRVKSERGRITTPITRDPVRRTRMTTKLPHGRSAITEYKVLRRWDALTFLEVRIGTGRTHQIRVHLASIGHPVAGDKLYGAPPSPAPRVFLHSHQITFSSPTSGTAITVKAPLPPDLQQHLEALK
jgi:23S rRNA pseudouridine1911/1915/1917 synthase